MMRRLSNQRDTEKSAITFCAGEASLLILGQEPLPGTPARSGHIANPDHHSGYVIFVGEGQHIKKCTKVLGWCQTTQDHARRIYGIVMIALQLDPPPNPEITAPNASCHCHSEILGIVPRQAEHDVLTISQVLDDPL